MNAEQTGHIVDDLFDDYDYSDDYDPSEGITCRRCKASGLSWEQQGGKYRLIEPNGENHVCSAFNETVNDFEVLP